ncbi:hypothetical protein MWU58_00435 [Flavobacteriaceae bacterium S0825]|uniref:hypothetical protein n=1 Tax=Gaetbulibacter sp. S0825 TaxID=2720084 RepID=UPI00142FF5C7|nr:hypothetical protein [Gaetbulibacter sp. S0825]MCK0107747.1 hypothetical protein [Flavobacteriaceae bacterium S0825]NIX63383.1 hypothetical protein [Gaetbulibacter sp. S0825]
MNGSLGHFKATLLRRKQRKEKQEGKFNKQNLDFISNKVGDLEFPKPSSYELKKINETFKNKIRKHKIKETVVFVIVMIVSFTVLFLIIW